MRTKSIAAIAMCLFLTLSMMPVSVFAADVEGGVEVDASNTDVSTSVEGSVTNNDGKGVSAKSNSGNTASVNVTGNVTAKGIGTEAKANYDGKTEVKVGGNIESSQSDGVYVDAEDDANVNVDVGGNIVSHGRGVYVDSDYDASTTVNVDGDVESKNSDAVKVDNDYGGTAKVNVGGNLTAKEDGIDIYCDGKSVVNVNAAGSVTSEGYGIYMYVKEEGSMASVAVKGDVTGGEDAPAGISLGSDNGGKNDVLVEGTVKGTEFGIQYEGDNDDEEDYVEEYKYSEVTVWKVLPGSKGIFAYGKDYDTEEPLEAKGDILGGIRDHVHYIVKLEQPEGATLKATKSDGTALDQMHDFDTAKYGERVLLKVDLQPGYKLDGAYNGDGEKVALLQDENDNYYIDAQDGGGIYLSVVLSKTKHNIKFNLDGGSYKGQIGTISQVHDYGTLIKLLGTPQREGYKFLYWKGSKYAAGADYTVEGDHEFTAVWEKIAEKETPDDVDKEDTTANQKGEAKTASASPETADVSELGLWMSILAAAIMALVYFIARRREVIKK